MIKNKNAKPVIPAEIIENKILFIRGRKVMLDADLAALYGVPTKVFNQAIKRNMRRFPADFMLRLTSKEGAAMRSQSVTASRRNIRHRPFAFTEQGMFPTPVGMNRLTQGRGLKLLWTNIKELDVMLPLVDRISA